MENIISTISDVCGILAFVISLFVAGKVNNISNRLGVNEKVVGQNAVGWNNKQKSVVK